MQKQHEADSTQDECYYHVHTVNCPVYVLYNDEKQEILIPSTTEMSRKENAKALFNDENSMDGMQIPTLMKLTQTQKHFHMHIMMDPIK